MFVYAIIVVCLCIVIAYSYVCFCFVFVLFISFMVTVVLPTTVLVCVGEALQLSLRFFWTVTLLGHSSLISTCHDMDIPKD